MPSDTPAAVIRWGTVGEQETLVGTVGTIADLVEARRLQPPAVAVVGEVVRLRAHLNWFERKPLFGRCIVVTRPRHQAGAFVDRLRDAGADVLCAPSIDLVPPRSWAPVDAAIAQLHRFDWVVFTSANGVEKFFARLRERRCDVRALQRAHLAAVGPQTAEALGSRGLLVDIVPDEYRAEGVAAALQQAGIAGSRVLLPRAASAREILPELLRAAGANVEEVAVYETVRASTDASVVRQSLVDGRVDLVTFTSSSTVKSFLASLGDDAVPLLARTAIGCIGPITAETARAMGLQVVLQPRDYTIPAFAEAIIAYFASGRGGLREDA
jgi:uroporphyrinogen III methyltransferase/synthase